MLFSKTLWMKLQMNSKSASEKRKFRFIGVDVERKADGSINISQETYKESLATIEVKNSEDNTRGLTKEEFKMYRGAIGKLTWLSEMSRPDLSFDTLDLAGYNNNATIQQLKRINKVVEKAKNEEGSVLFRRIGDFRDLKVLAISDGGLNRREDWTQSIMGKIVLLSNKEETIVAPLLWKSKTIQTVCKSAKTVETRACDKVIEDGIYLARCISEVYTGKRGDSQIPVHVVNDSQSLIDSVNSTRQVEEKLMRPLVKWIKQMMDAGCVSDLRWCDTQVCLSDALTKPGSRLAPVLLDIWRSGNMIDISYSRKK